MAFFGLTALGSNNPFADEKLDRLTCKSVEEFHQGWKTVLQMNPGARMRIRDIPLVLPPHFPHPAPLRPSTLDTRVRHAHDSVHRFCSSRRFSEP